MCSLTVFVCDGLLLFVELRTHTHLFDLRVQPVFMSFPLNGCEAQTQFVTLQLQVWCNFVGVNMLHAQCDVMTDGV